MLDSASKIKKYTSNHTYDDFINDDKICVLQEVFSESANLGACNRKHLACSILNRRNGRNLIKENMKLLCPY